MAHIKREGGLLALCLHQPDVEGDRKLDGDFLRLLSMGQLMDAESVRDRGQLCVTLAFI